MIIAQIIFFATIISYFAFFWKIFPKAGKESKAGFIPVYNILVWLQIIKKPWWWILLLIVPGVNFLMLIVMHVELARSFGQRTPTWYLLAILLPPVAIAMLAFKDDIKYTGLPDFKSQPKGFAREWGEAIIFAVVAATIIRTFFLEAFTIPTPSMEKSLLVGDYLFVSKVSYGARLPMTPIAFPLTHHTIPVVNVKSYLEWQKLPYFRLPGFGDVERFDATVFNFPAGDTVVTNWQDNTYYQMLRNYGRKNVENPDYKALKRDADGRDIPTPMGEIMARPVDKRENYIKRTIGLPGETLEVKDRKVFIDGSEIAPIPGEAYYYAVFVKSALSKQVMKERNSIDVPEAPYRNGGLTYYYLFLTEEEAEIIGKMGAVDSVMLEPKRPSTDLHIYPNHPDYSWTENDFGPLWIPAKGETIALNLDNLPLYLRPIEVYEHNNVEVKNGAIFINGDVATDYTFKQDYYFMMGDNRHNSADSRFWGFVPHDHIVGKAVFIWFSKGAEDGIRWNRLFTKAR